MADKYYTPGEDPGGNDPNRFLMMVVFFVISIIALPLFFKQPPAKPTQQQGNANQAPTTVATNAPTGPAAGLPTSASVQSGKGAGGAAAAVKQASAEQDLVVENDLYKITFTNRGAQVKSWILKKETDDKNQPLELVHPVAAPQFGYPLSLWTYDEGLRKKLNDGLYVTPESGTVQAPASVSFEYSDGELVAKKTFSFDHSYIVHIETAVTRNGAAVQAYPAWPAGLGDQIVRHSLTGRFSQTAGGEQVQYQSGDTVVRHAPFQKNWFSHNQWVANGETINGPLNWAGVADQFFGAMFLPDQPQQAVLVTLHDQIDVPKDPSDPNNKETMKLSVLGTAVGNAYGATSERLFVGPKGRDVLGSVRAMGTNGQDNGPSLEATRDLGTFAFIAKPMFVWLKWTRDHLTHNWGWAIVVLTIIINLALTPLRLTQMKTSLKMQRIQPQVKSVQKKYEKYELRDPRRMKMNQELQELYAAEGVSMMGLGGCLLLLPQLPFLYAFYAMLANAIELRHTGWLWIHDLSSPDPWHLLPLLTIFAMFMAQRMTPMVGMDPAQRTMMMVMSPLMFGIFTWTVSAGLALYWSVGNVIMLGLQFVINRTKLGRELREIQLRNARKK